MKDCDIFSPLNNQILQKYFEEEHEKCTVDVGLQTKVNCLLAMLKRILEIQSSISKALS